LALILVSEQEWVRGQHFQAQSWHSQ